MITEQKMFLDILGAPHTRYTIPVFQRVYSWNQEQCQELFNDVMRAGRTGVNHFIGTLLYSREPGEGAGADAQDGEGRSGCAGAETTGQELISLSIIDGQQRTATLTLMLAAFAKHLEERNISFDGIDAQHLKRTYLYVGEGPAQPAAAPAAPAAGPTPTPGTPFATPSHKLVLSRADRKTLFALLEGTALPQAKSERVHANYTYFLTRMKDALFSPRTFWTGMSHLLLISANLTADDRPQLIFESLNSRGTPLTTGDLVRNYLLMSESPAAQERLYTEYWRPIELMFGDDPESAKLNAAIRMWLTIRFVKERVRDKDQTYSVFKAYVEDEYKGPLEDLLIELRDFCLMWSENYKDHDINTGSKEFRSWNWAKGKRTTLVPPRASQGGF